MKVMSSSDQHLRRRSGRPGGCRRGCWFAGLAALVAVPAFGQVTLDTAVMKVETTLEAGGRVKRELVPVEEVVPGEELRYTITFSNASGTVVEPERIVITNPIPDGTVYLTGSAGGEGTVVEYSLDGQSWNRIEPGPAREPAGESAGITAGVSPRTGAAAAPATPRFPADAAAPPAGVDLSPVRSLRWTYREPLAPGESGQVFFHVRMQ